MRETIFHSCGWGGNLNGLTRWFDGCGVELMISVVFMFCVSVLKELDCSLRLDVGEQSGSEPNAISLLFALTGGGA